MAGLSKPIRLEKYVTTKDGDGNNTETVSKFNFWAEVKRNSGGRTEAAGQPQLTNDITFKVRFRPDFDVSGNWRVVYDQRRFTVNSIDKDKEQRFYWIIKATSQDKK